MENKCERHMKNQFEIKKSNKFFGAQQNITALQKKD